MTPRVELLIIGNEVLSGHTLDTNSQWLAQRLFDLALPVNQILVIQDDVTKIAAAIRESQSRNATLLITSGGLGPTFDDITAEGLAQAIGTSLKRHPQALEMVTTRYKELKSDQIVESEEMTPAREKMAYLPQGAEPIPNSVGTAPGIHFYLKPTHIYCLPGVPDELYAMFLTTVAPRISSLTDSVFLQKLIKVPILDESHLAPLIDTVMKDQPEIYIKSLPRPYQSHKPLRVVITVNAKTDDKAKTILEQTIQQLQKIAQTHRQI